jgi:radical SAM protein
MIDTVLSDLVPAPAFRFDDRPRLVYWEATQACGLSCRHCRAEAVRHRSARELDTSAAQALFVSIASFGSPRPHLVITGGDPLERPDLIDLIIFGRSLGLSISVTPAGTPELSALQLAELASAGVASLALSLDGASAASHDGFRGVEGSFDATVAAARTTHALGMPLQINTLVTAASVAELDQMYELVHDLGTERWALFFLIQVGRGKDVADISAAEAERVLVRIAALSRKSSMVVKTTEAHHYRRVIYSGLRARGVPPETILKTVGRGFGIRDGNGIVFVAHDGNVFPSGFLPLTMGNVKETSLVDIYRYSRSMQQIRDTTLLLGKCGACEYRDICGGSRARAYAATGDLLASDPLCAYVPSGWVESTPAHAA